MVRDLSLNLTEVGGRDKMFDPWVEGSQEDSLHMMHVERQVEGVEPLADETDGESEGDMLFSVVVVGAGTLVRKHIDLYIAQDWKRRVSFRACLGR